MTPSRVITGQKTKLTRVAHGIIYDPGHDEVFASAPLAGAIVVFKGGQQGDQPPIRVIQGEKTRIHDPWGLAVDDVHDELVVADFEQGAILVFKRDADGNSRPLRLIRGPKTGMFGVSGVAVDPERNLIVAMTFASGGHSRRRGGGGSLLIFDRTADGDVAPRAAIKGSRTGIISGWHVAVHHGRIFASVNNLEYLPPYDSGGFAPRQGCKGPPLAPLTRPQHVGFIGVWNITDDGNVAPRGIIRGPTTELVEPGGIVLDPNDGELFVTDPVKGGVFGFDVPDLFSQRN